MKKTTYQIISELPKDATEWQKDSAVQAYFHPGEDNHYSERPDTLGLPGQRCDRPAGTLSIDSLGYPHAYIDKLTVRHQGKATMLAEPAPYVVRGDNLVSMMLIGGVVVALVALALSSRFVMRMTKNFFFAENERTTTVPDTASELRNQGVLVAFTAVLLAIIAYCYSVVWGGNEFLVKSRHWMLWVYLAAIVIYFLVKTVLYQFVNWVFFDRKKIEQWNKSMLFLTAMEGVLLTPVVLLLVYGDISMGKMLFIVLIVAFLVKMCTFYKCYLIFFRRIGAVLQIFLYFCALEMIPLVVTVGLLETFNHNLKINF